MTVYVLVSYDRYDDQTNVDGVFACLESAMAWATALEESEPKHVSPLQWRSYQNGDASAVGHYRGYEVRAMEVRA